MIRYFITGALFLAYLASPGVTAQTNNQQRYGYPHSEPSFVDDATGHVVIPCLSEISGNKILSHYSVSLLVATETFPLRFELQSAEAATDCSASTSFTGPAVSGLVEVTDELDPEQRIPYHFALTYQGPTEAGVEEFLLEENALFQVVEGFDIVQSLDQQPIALMPATYHQENVYELRDTKSGKLLNEDWQLISDVNELRFTPIGRVYCDVTLADVTNGMIDYVTIDTGSGASDSSHPSLRSCDLNEVYDRYNFGLFDLPAEEQSLDFLAELGTGWVRAQFRLGESNPDQLAVISEQLFASDNRLWLTLHYRNGDNIADQAGFVASERGSYPPVDTDLYKQEVTDFINLFVAQLEANNQLPEDFLIVQFSNEVVPSDVAPDQPLRYFHGTGTQYIDMLSLTNDAVKATGYPIPVAPGGFASSTMGLILDYESDPVAFADLQPIYDWNVRMLRDGVYQWVDVHMRNELESIPGKVDWIRKVWRGPISATEVGGFCDSTCTDAEIEAYTPEVQAMDLPLRMQAILETGITTAFWASLVESPDQEPQYEKEGLLTTNFEKKPAFDAYRDLIAELVAD